MQLSRTPQNQTLENWLSIFDQCRENCGSETILIGHSLGGAFLLRVLESYNVRVKAAFIVAAPVGVLPIKNYEGDKPFIGHPFSWKTIRERATESFVFHSDNDPYVCLGNGRKLAEELQTELTFVPGAGHFNEAAGYTQFDLLLEKIQDV